MNMALSLQYLVPHKDSASLSHQLDKPLFIRMESEEGFSITTQIPGTHYLEGLQGKKMMLSLMQQYMRLTAKLAATRLLSFLLRLAAAPCAARHSLSTSAHCLVNVMRRHGWLSHAVSVKHYEAVWC